MVRDEEECGFSGRVAEEEDRKGCGGWRRMTCPYRIPCRLLRPLKLIQNRSLGDSGSGSAGVVQ